MSKRRFKQLGMDSFFGNLVYDRAVPESHFLRKLEEILPWEQFTERLIKLYEGRAEKGRPPYDPVVILKMLLLSYLYDLSERQTERFANDSLSAKHFLGLAVDEAAPDHSTLTAFKKRIIDNHYIGELEELLKEIVQVAQEREVHFGQIQVVDSTHTVANVNTGKDDGRQKKENKGPRDRGAKWGAKHQRRYRDENGEVKTQTEYFYGYKAHTSMNAEAQMITSVVVTAGNASDGKQFADLVDKDGKQNLPVRIYGADRGYDDSENHCLLQAQGLHSAILLNTYRTAKKDSNKQVWIALKETAEYQAGQRERYKIERKYGEAKENHGLRRCRYLGYLRYTVQAYLTVIVLNLKRMVKLITGTNFKGRANAQA